MAYKKNLHRYHPTSTLVEIKPHRTKQKERVERSDAQSIERDVPKFLADKISDNLVGICLLLCEHLRLGTYDLLKAWSGVADEQMQTRLVMQLVNERALCVKGIRQKRTLSQQGFKLANSLPFITKVQPFTIC